MPSFGLLKEQVLANLEEKYANDKPIFEENVKKFVKALMKSPVLSEMFRVYNELLQTHFDDAEYAKQYLEESVNYLRSLPITKKDLSLLENLERTDVDQNKILYVDALDTLVFSTKKDIKARVESKQLLTHKMITENAIRTHIDPRLKGIFIDILKKKIEHRLHKLNETELKALTAFAEQDTEALLANYIRLIDDNVSAIDEELEKTKPTSESYKKLEQAKNRLVEMRNDQPTLNNLEKLLVLKEGFGE